MCVSLLHTFHKLINTATCPEFSHPVTMTPTTLSLALADAKATFSPIVGHPTNNDLVCINDALAPILLKIMYDLSNGEQNLWGLIANVDRYLHHYGLSFVCPATRLVVYDPNIANDASRVEHVCAEATWACPHLRLQGL